MTKAIPLGSMDITEGKLIIEDFFTSCLWSQEYNLQQRAYPSCLVAKVGLHSGQVVNIAHTRTNDLANVQVMYRREHIQTLGECAHFTQKRPREIKSAFLPWGKNINHCNLLPPATPLKTNRNRDFMETRTHGFQKMFQKLARTTVWKLKFEFNYFKSSIWEKEEGSQTFKQPSN